ncbi:Uncharacterized conserved protein YjbJ, UPF0337 family [Rhizobiales bacterium GAS191]|nr:Uncharacterized conserved protein YjbJ, UPF0337 family [Rhizobiales bacterium GAS191]
MDTDRIAGATKEAKGAIREMAGKITGNEKLKAEGKADKIAGKVQNAFGQAKDNLLDAVKRADEAGE